MKTIYYAFLLTLLSGIILGFNLLAHEFGHCLTMNAVGGGCAGIYVMPGVQVWPLSQLGQQAPGFWGGYIGMAVYAAAPPSSWHGGLVSLMGSGMTAIFSVLAVAALWLFRFPKWIGWGCSSSPGCSWTC